MTALLLIVFITGYLAIVLEHSLKINKAATALVTGILCWTVYAVFSANRHAMSEQLLEHLGEVAGILFFLLGAMTIVELIDAHDGFQIIARNIQTTNKKKLVWAIAFISFFLSAVLDNLTTTIVMVSLLRKLINNKEEKWQLAGLVVIASNAGGAWSPIGDVTTTMLWIGGQITALNIIKQTFLPSLICLLLPALLISRQLKGNLQRPGVPENEPTCAITNTTRQSNAVFFLGLGCLLFVPIFKTITHLPPYMGILLGLGILWVITEIIHSGKDEEEKGLLSVNHALKKIDAPSILFFLGILLAVGALQSTGLLGQLAASMNNNIHNINVITVAIGLLSAVVDNVPLMAAVQGMYSLEQYPTDHYFWEFMAYCSGTGGSALIIGSAAGVAAMGMENIPFFWYLKKISWLALLGYLAGAAFFLLQHSLF
jgi:NhaD family Na+/H+ antiporter